MITDYIINQRLPEGLNAGTKRAFLRKCENLYMNQGILFYKRPTDNVLLRIFALHESETKLRMIADRHEEACTCT